MKCNFDKQTRWVLSFVFALAFLNGITFSAAYAAGYVSVHDYPNTYTWKDEQGVMHSEIRRGVKDRGNPNLPQVLCRNYYCAPRDVVNILDLTQDMSPQVVNFRMYIPPGTVYTNLLLYMARDASCASVARFGSPPTGTYTDYNALSYADDYDGATLQEVQAGEMTAVNRGGTMQIITDRSATPLFRSYSTSSPHTAGGWLYVRLIVFSGSLSPFYRISWNNQVDMDIYKRWYNSMSAAHWDQFDSFSAVTPANPPTPTNPTPSPSPSPSPTPDDDSPIFGGGDGSGGYQPPSNGGGFPSPSPTPSPSPSPSPTPSPSPSPSPTPDDNDSPIFGGGSGGQKSDPPTPSFLPDQSQQGWSDLSIIDSQMLPVKVSDVTGKTIQPELTVNTGELSGKPLLAYAGLKKNGMYYIAQENHLGEITFVPLASYEGTIPDYDTVFVNEGKWTCDAFLDLGLDNSYITDDIVFYFGVMPSDGSSGFRGAAFTLTP